MVERAIVRADMAGAAVDVIALAAVRATREAEIRHGGRDAALHRRRPGGGRDGAGGRKFDGVAEVAVFPGDLPADPDAVFRPGKAGFRGLASGTPEESDFRFLRFRPPPLEPGGDGPPALPHIRLDRALQFLIGDRLK